MTEVLRSERTEAREDISISSNSGQRMSFTFLLSRPLTDEMMISHTGESLLFYATPSRNSLTDIIRNNVSTDTQASCSLVELTHNINNHTFIPVKLTLICMSLYHAYPPNTANQNNTNPFPRSDDKVLE